MKPRKAIASIVLLALAAASGCAQGPPPTFYILDARASPALAGVERGVAVGVGPVTLPAHLDRPQIVTRAGDYRLDLSEANHWAEPLKGTIARVVSVHLANELQSNRVYVLPRRERTPLDYQVVIDFERFDGVLGEAAVVVARWSVLDGEGGARRITRLSIVTEPTADGGYEALVASSSRALERLSLEIAAAIAAGS
ncbi:MAG: PqiC family protein [Gammaproteobacteria bacterium]|nr:PqiC family protein [Gammaproteobacteria bacterium]